MIHSLSVGMMIFFNPSYLMTRRYLNAVDEKHPKPVDIVTIPQTDQCLNHPN